jgi:hypothetical protein
LEALEESGRPAHKVTRANDSKALAALWCHFLKQLPARFDTLKSEVRPPTGRFASVLNEGEYSQNQRFISRAKSIVSQGIM